MKTLKVFLFGEKDTLAKKIVNFGLIFLVIAGITEYGIKNDGDMSGLLKKETWDTGQSEHVSLPQNDTIYIVPMENIHSEDIRTTEKTIEKYFGLPTKLLDKVEISESLYFPNTDKLDAMKCIHKLGKGKRTIFLTNEKLAKDNGKRDLHGHAAGKYSIVRCNDELKFTVVHEIGHNKGLIHCKNVKCIMSTYEDGKIIKDGIHFCDDCSSKITLNENI